MRSDMDKVIVETGRRGLRQTRKALRLPPLDAFPPKMGMGRPHVLRGWRRGNDDHLAPLRRFLRTRCGHPWDAVWAEICAATDARSTVQHHVRIHVPDFVAIHTRVGVDGRIWTQERWGGLTPLEDTRHDVFVDPVDGVVKPNVFRRPWSRRWRAPMEPPADRERRMREVSRFVQLHDFGEAGWWEVRLARLPHEGEYAPDGRYSRGMMYAGAPTPEEDVVFRAGLSTLPRVRLYGRTGVYAVAKRQLSKREIKRLGLRD